MDKQVSIFVMTYNLAASDVPHGSFSFIPNGFDIYVLGFEEVGPFVPIACLAKQEALSNELRSYFGEGYIVITDKSMLAIKLFIAVRETIKENVIPTECFLVPTGADGQYGNKGAVAVSVNLYESKILFVCSHFAPHKNAVQERNQNYTDIVSKIAEYSDGVSPLESHNYIIWFGDLNYRINKPYQEAKRLAMSGRLSDLKQCDQLLTEKSAMRVFNGFFEEEINFPPTYKFDKQSLVYDTSKKKRIPSYTDRILFYAKSRKTISVSNYSADMNILISDHRPVTANVNITIVDKPKTIINNEQKSVVCRI